MTDQGLGLPFRLDPLIAEARRRAKGRRVLIAVAIVLVVGGGAGSFVSFGSSGPAYVPVRPVDAAIRASVDSFSQLMRPSGVSYSPLPYFAITVYLRNGSRDPVTLERVRAVASARSSLRQIGTRFFGLYKPYVCPPQTRHPDCLGSGDPATQPPFRAESFTPVTVPPGHTTEAQLNFRILGCTSGPLKEAVSIKKITVVYRLPQGKQIHQRPSLRVGPPAVTTVYSTAAAANPWPGALPSGNLRPAYVLDFGEVTTTACHR